MFVIFIVWESFGKQGQEVLSHPNPYVIVSPYPQKISVIASSENIRCPILSDFKLDIVKGLCTSRVRYTNNNLVHWYSWLDAQNML